MKKRLSFLLLWCCFLPQLYAQKLVSNKQQKTLTQLGNLYQRKAQNNKKIAYQLAKKYHLDTLTVSKNGTIRYLHKIDAFGHPQYLKTFNNTIAAATTGTQALYLNGGLGININGSSAFMSGKLAIWDGGLILTNHQEFTNRIVVKDGATDAGNHQTHVAGTMMAQGINPLARGMAWAIPNLQAYDFDNDLSEIAIEAPNLLVSNHSYGNVAGWDFFENRWDWHGIIGQPEDYKFGFYSDETQQWDEICYNAPYYLPVLAAGNSRNDFGPAVGQPYYAYPNGTTQPVFMGNRPAGISNNDGYDILSSICSAKNGLTVGAVYGIEMGYMQPSDVKMSAFSSWGPTDDGRIKPDLVGDGVAVTSTSSSSPTAYQALSGTSMATPNVSGSLILLQEYYAQLHSGNFMRAATLKALAIHTADEAGANPGPDYSFGWGLLNMQQAATTIKNNGSSTLILEGNLMQDSIFTKSFTASGLTPVKITIAWTDPTGSLSPDGTLNNRTPKLVNDLDLRLDKQNNFYLPWVLEVNNPAKAATTGDNVRDNVEQIIAYNAQVGDIYTFRILHKGQLFSNTQNYSMVISGIDGGLQNPIYNYDFNLKVFPIPTQGGNLNVSFNSYKKQTLEIVVINNIGQKVYFKSIKNVVGQFLQTFDLSSLPQGIYFFNIKLGDKTTVKKIEIL